MSTHPMSPVDAAWFHIDGPVNSAVITSVLTTRQPLDFERVRALYTRRLARFPRFRQRVVEKGFPLATPHWEEMPDFALEQQLHHVALPPPGDRAALTELIEDLASTPLDRARPLWDVHVASGFGRGSALVTRIHHCIGDGTANLAIARALFDTSADAPLDRGDGDAIAAQAEGQGLFASAFEAVEKSIGGVRAAVAGAMDTVRHPGRAVEHAARLVAGAVTLAGELARRRDSPSPLKGEFGLRQRIAWSQPVPLADVKAIGAPLGAKINDVLVAGMTGALRAYLKGRGVPVDTITVHAMVPVDLRPPERALELGNEFGLVILELALASSDPMARVRLTKSRMDSLKRSPEPAAILALFNLFGRGPKVVEDFAVQLFGTHASLVMTNVAGPKETLYLAGVPVERVMFWVPHPGRELGMGISILSYRGHATLAVIADAHLVPDPDAITAQFHREFDAMLAQVNAKKARSPKRGAAAVAAKRRAAPKSARR